ncbi:hypothetical protein DXT99_23480 [Pontibacter diazotrophicus]|uniref:Uncharacterized protein n=1 Tax=Pontibacter diazotrophicus TaxID=1400979 RepID=A0A3D8L320_9BACT|nr:hypothetical protein [Pontibacter diazotrophicus]RDV11869.1 hypothetical protein DXT99_23480 [Pontibacter diazotrophicus]
MAKQAKPDFKSISRGMTSFDRQMYEDKPEQAKAPEPAPEEAGEEELMPFATRLPASLVMRIRQHSYWDREGIMETVTNAVVEYLDKQEGSDKPLPPEVLKKASRGRKKK